MKKSVLIRLAALALCAALAFAAVGCGKAGDSTAKDDSLQKILDKGELVLGLDAGFPPMGFTDENGEIVGFDIDVAREVCKRLGVTLVTMPIDWDEKEDDLNCGKIDCIWNGMSVTPARAESMNLSEPYMKNEMILVVLAESDIKSVRDLTGKTVGAQSGSTANDVLKEASFYPDITPKLYEENQSLFDDLEQKKVDAALVDSVAAYYFIFSKDDSYFVLPDSLGEEDYAIGFRKGDQTLRDEVQKILGEMKADGSLGEISKKWFGGDITTVR